MRVLGTVLFLVIQAATAIDYDSVCSYNSFEAAKNSSHMQFTKEVVSREYSILGKFKSLHCCAKGYRSIEWFKDGKPYPWTIEESSFILYPEAENQTIYSRETNEDDPGEYKCIVRNETHVLEKVIKLKTKANSVIEPLATYTPEDQYANLLEPVRFYCEAFIGNLGFPDAKTSLSWHKLKDDYEELFSNDVYQEQVSRESGEIVGSYLMIPNTKTHHYGKWICRIEIGNSRHRLELSAKLLETSEGSQLDPTSRVLFLLAILMGAALGALILKLCLSSGRKQVQQILENFNQKSEETYYITEL